MANPTEHFHETVRFICPFCKRKCSAGYAGPSAEMPLAEMTPVVTHETPMCQKFESLEIDDFLHEVNIQYGAHN